MDYSSTVKLNVQHTYSIYISTDTHTDFAQVGYYTKGNRAKMNRKWQGFV